MTHHDRQTPFALMVQTPLSDADRQHCEMLLSRGELDAFRRKATMLLKTHDDVHLWKMLGRVEFQEIRIK
ncbi:MAG: hypothetical protein P8X76_06315, partial [Maritimibacter sp.]